ncbi:hypothetical protein [Sansalvadorimonas verongulae]|uniref:hypothetical protein n=1 Tax=Sansalvadorimonas verongulae TaxID=2172824 RepID=UPI0012BC22CB|nr:hypothetical protein [Sansalvadorimonas verongulae]MTI15109.1 hypothetical protein [Sansalvadorimonas verongulae]
MAKSPLTVTAFLLTVITLSLFAYAGGSPQEVQQKLTQTLEHWFSITPGNSDIDSFDYAELKTLDELNGELDPDVETHKELLPADDILLFKTQQAVTKEVLTHGNWKKAFETMEKGRYRKHLKRVLERPRTVRKDRYKSSDQSFFSDNQEHPEPHVHQSGSGFHKQLKETLDSIHTQLLKVDSDPDYWKLRFVDRPVTRITIDQRVINEVLTSFTHQEILDAFAERITASLLTFEQTGLDDLYAELMLLHIFLKPTQGLGTIHLGMHTQDIPYWSPTNRDFERAATVKLSGAALTTAMAHELSLPQTIEQHQAISKLVAALKQTISTHKGLMLTLDNSKAGMQTALALTAVLFDLSGFNGLQGTISLLAEPLKEIGYLWDIRACRYFTQSSGGNSQQKTEHCTNHILNGTPATAQLKTVIEGQLAIHRDSALDSSDKSIAYQHAYGAIAIRKMTHQAITLYTEKK